MLSCSLALDNDVLFNGQLQPPWTTRIVPRPQKECNACILIHKQVFGPLLLQGLHLDPSHCPQSLGSLPFYSRHVTIDVHSGCQSKWLGSSGTYTSLGVGSHNDILVCLLVLLLGYLSLGSSPSAPWAYLLLTCGLCQVLTLSPIPPALFSIQLYTHHLASFS